MRVNDSKNKQQGPSSIKKDAKLNHQNSGHGNAMHEAGDGARIESSDPASLNYDFASLPLYELLPAGIQTKLYVNTPGDAYEQEADAVADQILQMPESGTQEAVEPEEGDEKWQKNEKQKPKKGAKQVNTRKVGSGGTPVQGKGIDEVLQSPGRPLDASTRNYMEQRFGVDFSHIRIHDDRRANHSADRLNARAYAHRQHLVFAKGQYNPATSEGKKLLAHELTHVLQQGKTTASNTIQRANPPGVPDLIIENPGQTANENLFYLDATAPATVTRFGVMTSGQLKVYGRDQKKNGAETLLKTYKIKKSITPPPFLYILEASGFFIYAYDYRQEKHVFVGKKSVNMTPAVKAILDKWDAALSIQTWFENPEDLKDFTDNHILNQYFGLWVPDGASKGSGAGSGDSDIPPKPAWMKPYAEAVKKLIGEKKKTEPLATDLPDSFNFYYSKKYGQYRATAKRTDAKKKEVQVYLEVLEKTPVETTLETVRRKIRLSAMSEFAEPSKDDKTPRDPLKDELLWAMELLLGLRKKIKEERGSRTDRYDLPESVHVISLQDIPNQLFLTISVNITRTNTEGVASTETKTARLSEALRKDMTVDGVYPVVQQVTLALREDRRKRELDPKKEKSKYTKTLAAYPAEIIAFDTREDFIGVKGGVGNYRMKLDFERHEGGQLAAGVAARMQTIYYRWYAFAASDFLSKEELDQLAKIPDWKVRRPLLISYFKYKTMRQDSLYTWSGGWDIDPDGEVKLPNQEGDVVVFGQAFPQPRGDVYRIPSEAFFPVHLVDGYKLAREGVNAPDKNLKAKKDELAAEKAKGENASKDVIESLEAEIAALEATKGRSMLDNVRNSYDDTAKALKYAKMLKKILEQHPKDFAKYIFSATDDKVSIGADLFRLFTKIISEDTRQVSQVEKIDWAITKISAQAESLKGILDRAKKFDGEVRQPVYSPITTFVSSKTATSYNLLMMLGESDDYDDYHHTVSNGAMKADQKEYKTVEYPNRTVMVLIDVTSDSTQRKYKGISDNPDKKAGKIEATKKAYEAFAEKAIYGTGYVHYKVPGLVDSDEGIDIYSSPGTWEQVKKALSIIAAVAGVVALVVGTVASGGALGAAAVALGLGAGAVGAGLAIGNISDRIENHTFQYDTAFAMDVLNIVGFFASATKLLGAARISKAAETAADLASLEKVAIASVRLESGFMAYQRVETATNVVLTTYQTAKDLEAIENSGLPDKQKRAARNALLGSALLSGTMIALQIKDSFKSKPALADEMARLLKIRANSKKYIALNKELGLMDEQGNWLLPEMKKSAEGQEARVSEAEAAVKAKGEIPEVETKKPGTEEKVDVKPAPDAAGGGAGIPPVKGTKPPPGGGGGKPKKAKLDPESKKVIDELDARIADLKKRQEAGDTGAAYYIDALQQAKSAVQKNPGGETIANARETMSDLAASYPNGTIVAPGVQSHFKQNGKKISDGNGPAILEFLGQAKTWKEAVSFLQGQGKRGKKALEAIQSYREGIMRELDGLYQARERPGASQKPESDKDLNFPGEKAGANLIKAEAEMRAKYGDDWSAKLRMNFYAEGERLTMFQQEAGNLPPDARAKIEADLSRLSNELALAKMLRHAHGNEGSVKRVEKVIDASLPQQAKSIHEVANMPADKMLAKRDALHLEVDSLRAEYNNPETPEAKRPLIAAEITKKQMEINFLTEEAYISPAALRIADNINATLTPQESVSSLLANMEMIEHIIHQAGGDIVVAARQYEIYKYMLRGTKSMQHKQQDLFFDQMNKVIATIDRDGAKTWTEGQLRQHFNDFMQMSYKYLNDYYQHPATGTPAEAVGPAGTQADTTSAQLELFGTPANTPTPPKAAELPKPAVEPAAPVQPASPPAANVNPAPSAEAPAKSVLPGSPKGTVYKEDKEKKEKK